MTHFPMELQTGSRLNNKDYISHGQPNLKTPNLSLIDVLKGHNDGHSIKRRETIYELDLAAESESD